MIPVNVTRFLSRPPALPPSHRGAAGSRPTALPPPPPGTRFLSQPPSLSPSHPGAAGGRPKTPPLAGDPPCGGALPHVAHHALEGLGAVAEGADAAVPVTLVRGGFRLPLRPAETHERQGQHRARRPHPAALPPLPRGRPAGRHRHRLRAPGRQRKGPGEREKEEEEALPLPGRALLVSHAGSRRVPGAALCVCLSIRRERGGSLGF